MYIYIYIIYIYIFTLTYTEEIIHDSNIRIKFRSWKVA